MDSSNPERFRGWVYCRVFLDRARGPAPAGIRALELRSGYRLRPELRQQRSERGD